MMQLVGNIYIPDGDRHFVKLGPDIERYQEPQRLKAMEYVTDWSRAVDLGAHVGLFSRHFARHFDEVVAFEPTLETRLCLERNVPANVRIIPYACGDRDGEVTFRQHSKNSGATEIADTRPEDDGQFTFYTQRMITLDSLALDKVGLIKIDVQGAEPLVIRGAAETLRRSNAVVLVEEKPLADQSNADRIQESRDLLLGFGYRPGDVVGADRIYLKT